MPDRGSPAAVSDLRVAPERLPRRLAAARAPANALPRTGPATSDLLDQSALVRTLSLVRGRRAILDLVEPLRELARRAGQAGDADYLDYFLTMPDALRKTPWLIAETIPGDARTLTSAVLLFEYRFGPFASGVFATADATGRRGVLAEPREREAAAATAARRLLDDGAAMVHLAFSRTHHDVETEEDASPREAPGEQARRILAAGQPPRGQGRWAFAERDMRLYLPLAKSFDETLRRIGQRTRSNLRYYRRRAEAELGSEFVPQVQISREDFIALDRRCRYAVGDARARWRFDSLSRLRAPFLAGIRSTQGPHAGQWLGLVGGRQQNGAAEIDWQMNRADLPASSLSTVLRSYLIEHLVGLGLRRLYIEGGTPQPISMSFAAERVAELTVVRSSPYAWLLDRVAPSLAPKTNYLAQVLRQPGLAWHRW